jgi:hypothetical protein
MFNQEDYGNTTLGFTTTISKEGAKMKDIDDLIFGDCENTVSER